VTNQAKALWPSLSDRSEHRRTEYPQMDDRRPGLRQEARLCEFPEFVNRPRDNEGRRSSLYRQSQTVSRQVLYKPCIARRLRHTASRSQRCTTSIPHPITPACASVPLAGMELHLVLLNNRTAKKWLCRRERQVREGRTGAGDAHRVGTRHHGSQIDPVYYPRRHRRYQTSFF
jgi:hypothetical protein